DGRPDAGLVRRQAHAEVALLDGAEGAEELAGIDLAVGGWRARHEAFLGASAEKGGPVVRGIGADLDHHTRQRAACKPPNRAPGGCRRALIMAAPTSGA